MPDLLSYKRLDAFAWLFSPISSLSELPAAIDRAHAAGLDGATHPVFGVLCDCAFREFDRITILASGGFND